MRCLFSSALVRQTNIYSNLIKEARYRRRPVLVSSFRSIRLIVHKAKLHDIQVIEIFQQYDIVQKCIGKLNILSLHKDSFTRTVNISVFVYRLQMGSVQSNGAFCTQR